MLEKIIRYSIFIILGIGIIGAGNLVLMELKTGDGCPKIASIPMCAVILICFIMPLVAHILKKWNAIYYLFTGLAGSIALVASIMQFNGYAECPKTDLGTPMRYYSLLLFSGLVLLKVFEKVLSNTSKTQ